ncbi:DUF2339 domain-containing protein [Mesorhizobium sp. BR1-1-16]|uniref:DUF2339 domain-containing protein n=1 Tax=Mesorhizobium sp. BR1-1-16 TaxID=2876653 RepID=UPI001CCE9CC0|nr:DUF2339 domain-containing protein [Mesorhizobium sp. BR1-1-16]MBZ9938197.1 DUF2339 domain-containing protein [Mesorhizobium sp. BR1-1-16]
MDGLIAFGILLLIALPIITVVSFFMLIGTRRRLTAVERRLIAIEQGAGARPPLPDMIVPERIDEAPEVAAEPDDFAGTDATEPAPSETAAPARASAPSGPRESLEQKLGARWAVWVGGLALALGAIFLVRYSIDAGLLGPGIRVAFGAAFSLALLAAGEWLRRSPRVTAFSAIPAANIPGILTAAGTVGLFATVYAAYALYALIGPASAFILFAAIGLGTMAAAALHGPWLSGLGLVGAYATPLLVASRDPNLAILAFYLTFVSASAFGLARIRGWRWLAIAASVGALGWGLLMLVGTTSDALVGAAYALAFLVLTLVFLVIDVHRDSDPEPTPDWLASLVLAGAAALLVAGSAAHAYPATSIVAALFGGALMLAAAWRYDAVALGGGVAAALVVALLYFWPAASQAAAEPTTYVVDAVAAYFPLPATIVFFANVAAIGAAGLIATALARFRRHPEPGSFATAALVGAATAGPLLIIAMTYLRISGFTANPVLAAVALALAALYSALAARASSAERPDHPADIIATGLFAAGTVGAIAFALTMALDGGILTTAFALTSLGAAWVETKRPIVALRYAVLVMAIAVFGRIAWDPYVFDIRAGSAVYVSILAGYGIPTLAFGAAAVLLRRRATDRAALAAEAVALAMLALLVVFEIHAITFGGDLLAEDTRLGEQGLITATAFAFALGLTRLGRRGANPVTSVGAMIARFVGLLNAVIALGFALNPLVTGEPVAGSALLNEIVLAYWLPALLAGLLAMQPLPAGSGTIRRWLRLATGLAALGLAFGGISLEIRFLYAASPDLTVGIIGSAESYTYSAVWLVLGLLLLIGGLLFDVKAARLASAVVILIAVLKVFLIDMGSLEGIWRALSFMGLGLVLIGIGLLYQRLLFGGTRSTAPPAPEG